jgi:hypothetical protein
MVTKKSGGRKPPVPSGSPIIVDGGGSVIIDFEHGAFRKSGNKHKSKNPDLAINQIVVRVGGVNQPPIPVNGQPAKITVTLQE